MIVEDNNGFVNFPPMSIFDRKVGKTLVYIVAFDTTDISSKYILSNINLNVKGKFITDDLSGRYLNLDEEEGGYYPRDKSIYLTSCICVGWCENTYINREDKSQWYATFRDLSGEGRKLYYSIKKLHNNKEVRILTFNLD
jgi:hypothetical protein